MQRNDKIRELEKLLKELKAQEEETAVTYTEDTPRRKSFRFWKLPTFLWRFSSKTTIILALIAIILVAALPFAAFWAIQGSTFTETKGTLNFWQTVASEKASISTTSPIMSSP